MKKQLLAIVMAVSCAIAPSAVWAGPSGKLTPGLLKRLQTAMAAPAGFHDHYAAQVWLTDMSARLARYAPKAIPDPVARIKFLQLVHAEAERAKLSPELVLAVINIESNFRRFAISSAGAEGYMQIMPFWLQQVEAKSGRKNNNLFDPETNLRMGCTILRYYIDKNHDDWVQALAGYNGSRGKADYPYKVLHALNTRWSPG